ncbi:unannotated protein [freshwater metagenome]|uniref:Unannotated protein n=1 Tax=freshwater metagenome TaxID=449393 RepID=A0A6J7DAJ8_9ZZZZ|nr:hypothetical protein [Actinomycetota bacterium]
MMKRVSWFVSGAVAGVAAVGLAKKKVKATAAQLAPSNVARSVVAQVRNRGRDVAEALTEGRRAMHDKEAELRARRDGTLSSLADELQPDDQVLVDGQPIEPGKVIVLRQVHDNDHSGHRRTSRRGRRSA